MHRHNANTSIPIDAGRKESLPLIEQCKQGDAQAWAQLVQNYHGLVYSLCYAFSRTVADAEDLTQDAFVKIYGNLATFDPSRGDLAGWITVLTRNQLVDHFRRTRIQRMTDSMDAGWDQQHTQPLAHRLPDHRPTPLDQVSAKELRTILRQAIGQLSPEMGQAVMLRYFQGMEYRSIARFLKIPEGTVKSRINRGHSELARALGRSRAALSYI